MSKKLTRELIAQKVKSDRIESIRNLNLWGSNIDDISIIQDMPSLEIVSLSVNKIRTLRPFASLPNLKELYLRRNLISNLNEIKYLTNCENLSTLWLSENPICENPNYRSVVIGVLPQLVKLDDIMITEEERIKAEKKLSGNYDEEEDEGEEEAEEQNNMQPEKENMKEEEEERRGGVNSSQSRKRMEENDEGEYYNNSSNKNNINNNRRKPVNRFEEEENEEQPKRNLRKYKTTEVDNNYNYNDRRGDNRARGRDNNRDDEYEGYNNNRTKKGREDYNRHENKYEDNDYGYNKREMRTTTEKKKGNSNVLNCVICLLKELSHNELQVVKREIDRMDG